MRVTNLLKVLRATRVTASRRLPLVRKSSPVHRSAMSLIFFGLPQKHIISSRTTGRPSRPPTRCINRRRSRGHHLDPDHPNRARPPLLGPAQDSRSHHRSPYQLGRRYSNLAPDLSDETLSSVHRVSELRHPTLAWVNSLLLLHERLVLQRNPMA